MARRVRIVCPMCDGTGLHQQAGVDCTFCDATGRAIAIPAPPPTLTKEQLIEQWKRRHVLSQTEWWYPKQGDPVRLEAMSLRWKRNLLAFLVRRAPALHKSAAWEMVLAAGTHNGGDMAQDALDDIAADLMDAEPLVWLHEQPFVRRLAELVDAEADGPEDRHDPSKVVATDG